MTSCSPVQDPAPAKINQEGSDPKSASNHHRNVSSDIEEATDNGPEDSTALHIESSWGLQPLRLPAYTPSSAAREASHHPDSPPTTPLDDPIYRSGSKKHFGFSSRQSRASSIFPWQKHRPAVFHQYAPHRPPLSKRSSLAGLKVLPMSDPDTV
ncbi:hypothetical protein BGW38_008257, partial [Lunasporangiospora selenospora]